MSTILPFRQPSARTSPQHDRKAVPVNVTGAGRDLFVEARLRVLGGLWRAYWALGKTAEARAAWNAYMETHAKRSPAQVARIETARGCADA